MDHYTELVLAHAEGPGGKLWLDRIECEVLNAAEVRGALELDFDTNPPPDNWAADISSTERWAASRIIPGGVVWVPVCNECDGRGTVVAQGRTQSHEIDCPWCDDMPWCAIVTDAVGVFLRMATERESG